MKEQVKRLIRNFDLGAALSVGFLMTGAVLIVTGVVVSLMRKDLSGLLLMIPGIMSFATAAGLAL